MKIVKYVTDYALRYVGTPYIWGGDDFSGFDCSGFVQEILACAGLDPKYDQTANGLHIHFSNSKLAFKLESPREGALCFYGRSATQITHVAYCINDFAVIEAAGGGSKTKTRQDAIEQNAWIRIRPFKHRSDLISIVLPKYPKSLHIK